MIISIKFDFVAKLAFHNFPICSAERHGVLVYGHFVLQSNHALLAKQRGTFCFENEFRRAIIKSKMLLTGKRGMKVPKPIHQKLMQNLINALINFGPQIPLRKLQGAWR